jgi:5-methylcytosine-specific restriction endonuclease McrA
MSKDRPPARLETFCAVGQGGDGPAPRPCIICDLPVPEHRGPGRPRKVCSDECRLEYMRRSSRERKRRSRPRRGAVIQVCLDCPVVFEAKTSRSKRCESCQRRFRNRFKGTRRRRARKHGVEHQSYSAAYILNRDKWTCHLCNRRLGRSFGSHENRRGWVIDHLVPISAGGPDTPANVAAACWECNSRKGVKPMGEQLALVG